MILYEKTFNGPTTCRTFIRVREDGTVLLYYEGMNPFGEDPIILEKGGAVRIDVEVRGNYVVPIHYTAVRGA